MDSSWALIPVTAVNVHTHLPHEHSLLEYGELKTSPRPACLGGTSFLVLMEQPGNDRGAPLLRVWP
eukprot:11155802-Heterocapsa_arctica.AAC.1